MTNLVLFDGVCALCNRTVNFLIKIDRDKNLKYAPLQGETAKNILANYNPGHQQILNSIIFVKYIEIKNSEQFFERSEAVLEILYSVGGVWKFVFIFKLLPVGFRNYLYDFIAKHRYKWFGKHNSCRIPSPEERELFLN